MIKIDKNHVENLINNGYDFEIGKYISEGFNFYSANFLKVLLTSIVGMIVPILNIITAPNIFRGFEEIENESGDELNTLFKFDKAGQIIVMTLIYFAFYILLFLPLFFILGGASAMQDSSTYENPQAMQSVLGGVFYIYMILAYAVLFFFAAVMFFVIPLILFGDYPAWEAIQTSFKIAKKKVLHIWGLSILAGIIGGLGIIACYIGVFLSLPIYYCILYMAYKDILFSPQNTVDQIGVE